VAEPSRDDLPAEVRRLEQALALAERDRALVGYDIHDGCVQDLTAAAMLLDGVGRQLDFPSIELRENYEGGVRLLREAIAEARRLIQGLASVEIEGSELPAALQRLADKFQGERGLPVRLVGEGTPPPLPASTRHLLFRIAQEALNNTWKHAAASQVTLRLECHGQQLQMRIADDGRGFDPMCIPAGHFGLAGMRARAAVMDATLNIDSAPGQGTKIAISVPVA